MESEPRKAASAKENRPAPETSAPARSSLQGVWIVVLTWNGGDLAEACVESLSSARSHGAEVMVVDNASSDGLPERVRDRFPDVHLIENASNLGFAGGNNVGIRRALAAGAEFVVLLNQDASVAADWCEELVAAARRHPDAGTVGSKIFFADRPDVLWHAGATFSTFSGRSRHLGHGERDRGRFGEEIWVERPCACALLLRRSFLEEVGLLDEALFLYGEEIDLALRARASGFRHLVAPGARAWHHVSTGTGGPRSGGYLYYVTRNTLYLLRRHAPMRFAWSEKVRDGLVVATMAASIVTMRLDPRPSWRALRDGWRDFRRGYMGPRPEAGRRSPLSPPGARR